MTGEGWMYLTIGVLKVPDHSQRRERVGCISRSVLSKFPISLNDGRGSGGLPPVAPSGAAAEAAGVDKRLQPPFLSLSEAKTKDPRNSIGVRGSQKRRLPTLPTGGSVPSAMVSLTSLFGMVRGGSSPL